MLNKIERSNRIIVEERKVNRILGPHSEILLIKKANKINRINILKFNVFNAHTVIFNIFIPYGLK